MWGGMGPVLPQELPGITRLIPHFVGILLNWGRHARGAGARTQTHINAHPYPV